MSSLLSLVLFSRIQPYYMRFIDAKVVCVTVSINLFYSCSFFDIFEFSKKSIKIYK
jgi:hypothetical protein